MVFDKKSDFFNFIFGKLKPLQKADGGVSAYLGVVIKPVAVYLQWKAVFQDHAAEVQAKVQDHLFFGGREFQANVPRRRLQGWYSLA